MHSHSHCRFYNITREYSIADLAAFHGHLGPFIVLGYRIGKYTREQFCNDPFRIHASVHCSGKQPESCIVDGVQLGSGCTRGKRNIGIVVSPEDQMCLHRPWENAHVHAPTRNPDEWQRPCVPICRKP